MANEYCSYETLDAYKNLEVDEGGTATDVRDLRRFCTIASRMFDGSTRRKFYPRSKIRYYDHPADATRLKVDDDLLEVGTFTTQNGDEEVSSDDYYLMCGTSYNLMPYDRMVMKSDGDMPVLLYSDRLQKANALTAIWGYHEDWASAWQSANDTVQDDPLTIAATTLTVSDVDGRGIYGLSPRLKVQDLLKVGDEYLYVTGKNESANTLTVVRGVNGTTAAEHDNATAIYVYQPMVEIAHATKRLAGWLYAQRDAGYTDQLATVEIGGVVIIPKSAPADVTATAAMYRRRG